MSATAQKPNGRGPRVPLVTPPAIAPAPPEPPRPVEGLNLAAAVLAVQAEAPQLIRNATGQIQSRTYAYVTNDQVVEAVLPLLVKYELLWRTWPTRCEDGAPGLRYRMTHVPSGEYDEDVMPLMLDAQTSQALGSAITYDRRYSLTAYLNLTVDPDDDGAAASQSVVTQSGSTVPAGPQPTAAAPSGGGRPASAAQQKMLRAKARDAGLAIDDFANIIKVAAGETDPDPWQDKDAAQRWVDRALDRLPARLVDAVIEGIEGSRP